MLKYRSKLTLPTFALSLLLASPSSQAVAPGWEAELVEGCRHALRHIRDQPSLEQITSRIRLSYFEEALNRLVKDGKPANGSGIKVVMGTLELGKVPGLKTTSGADLDISAGGISAVINDVSTTYPRFLKKQKNAELVFVSFLRDGMSRDGLKHVRNIHVRVDGNEWSLGVFEYFAPNGAKYIFLENPSFNRFTAVPDKSVQGQSVYTMRGIDAGYENDRLEQQRIWSAINQGTAQIFAQEKGNLYVPHDSHLAPASFYIKKHLGMTPLSIKPLVHNERYLGPYHVPGHHREAVRSIWNVSHGELNEYFMQGDTLTMLAPAVRVAAQEEIYTALSVSAGTANAINGVGRRPRTFTDIDFMDRMGELTNGMADENRPSFSALLKPATEKQLRDDGITDPETIRKFTTRGFAFGFPGQPDREILDMKAEAKAALQRNFGMTVDPRKPLFISFARMVHQKGMQFVAENVRHILANGGQVIVGGPVGDAVGAGERQYFLRLRDELRNERNPNAHHFIFIDGAVKGRLKGLMLAGSDFFLIPSRFEPCGLTDCEALYHASIAIAHDVGGLDKGLETILYAAPNPDHQGWSLGQAIDEAFRRYADQRRFEKSQLEAMKQDFSMEKNFDKFLKTVRLETLHKMLRELTHQVKIGSISGEVARRYIDQKILTTAKGDVPDLISALLMKPRSRRTWTENYVVEKGIE